MNKYKGLSQDSPFCVEIVSIRQERRSKPLPYRLIY